ncbi:hybrid sensor histidine kinase/response regulator [Ghiorsea bivora]|uniref:hybrid sensor histidine kinase/response regulator n=1 Tax=Ghiorsea bivora TaxID=1485545 RepID=UPI000A7191F5|nr:ATP-binding protein [Ghiorsea bivora]
MDTINTTQALKIRKEQVYLLYNSSFKAAIATTIAACVLTYMQWSYITHITLILWLSLIAVISIARIVFYFAFKQKQPAAQDIKFWEMSYTSLTIGAGLAWGAAGIFLLPENNFEYQAATIILLAGMAAGATTTHSILRTPVFIFLFLTMVPLTINLLLDYTKLSLSSAFMCSLYTVFLAITANNLYKTHLQNITLRLQSVTREKFMRASQDMVHQTSKILEMIARGVPATEVYNAVALLYESRHPGMRCSLLELKGDTLIHGGAPSLPKPYCDAINGLKNGPNIGSCGTSTYTGERVLVEDIATDPKWENLKDVALPHGMRCCWSEPIKNNKGKVLGAFGMYYNHPALPNELELADLESGARLAGIVMERQQHEDLLQKLYGAFEHTQDAIMICDLEAKLEYVNPAFEKMTGYSAQEAVGQYIKILRSDQHPPSFYEKLEAQDHAGQHWQGEIIIKRKDGTFLEVERTVSPIFDQHGEAIFLVAIQRDLTEHKLLEAKFSQAQKMEAVGTLVGGIAHDFNNILAGITGNLYLLQMRYAQDSDAMQKLTRIEQLSDRATSLIQQMLTFARKDTVSMTDLNLNQLVTEVFGLIRTSIPKNIELNLDIEQNTTFIHGDTTQIHQVLLNLVNNARDAVENSSQPCINVTLGTYDVDEDFVQQRPYFKTGHYALLSIQDNGCGIPDEHLEHLFEPFFTTKDVGRGTGLGLSMVFGAVKRHQGFVEVASHENQGTTFHVYIPLLQNKTALPKTENSDKLTTKGHGELILLVDDEAMMLEMGTDVLQSLGYRVLQASDGLEAVDIFTANQHDIALVITDIVMPRLGGIEAAERIRNIQANSKIIFSSGYDPDSTLTQNILAKNEIILSKPYHINALSEAIAKALRNKQN